MEYSFLLPQSPVSPEQAAVSARIVRRTEATRLWEGQSLVLDGHHLASWLAGAGLAVPMGFGVSLMPMRSPYQAALEARSVALTTGRSVVAGFGPGSVMSQEGFLGHRYKSQLGACREYLRIVRGLLAGELVLTEGEHFSTSARLFDLPSPPVEVGLGVLRERMAVLAGEVADRAITWMGSAERLETALLPAMRSARRPIADPLRVTAMVPVALARRKRDVKRVVTAACGQHIQQSHYREALRQAGIRVAGDGDDAAKLLEGGVFLYGTAQEVHTGLRAYAEAGVDEVVLNVTGTAQTHGVEAALEDLEELIGTIPPASSRAGGVPVLSATTSVTRPLVNATLTESGSP